MRKAFLTVLSIGLLTCPALAGGMKASNMSALGQAPQTWDHEPGPGDRLERFQVIYVDNHACPVGQIEKFTAGSKTLGVKSTRECVTR